MGHCNLQSPQFLPLLSSMAPEGQGPRVFLEGETCENSTDRVPEASFSCLVSDDREAPAANFCKLALAHVGGDIEALEHVPRFPSPVLRPKALQ